MIEKKALLSNIWDMKKKSPDFFRHFFYWLSRSPLCAGPMMECLSEGHRARKYSVSGSDANPEMVTKKTSKEKVLLFQKIVPSYRVPIFRKLYEDFGIVVCHSREKKDGTWVSSHAEMDYPNILLKRFYYRNTETSVIQNVLPVLFRVRPKIVISEFSLAYLTFWLLWILKPFFGYKLVAWTHGVDNREVLRPFASVRGRLTLPVFRNVDGVLLYSNHRKTLIEKKIGRGRPLFVALNTLDTGLFKKIDADCRKKGKIEIRKELGFQGKYHLIYIGRLIREKKIDLILEAFELIDKGTDVSLHIIGDGPEMGTVRNFQKPGKKIFTYGAIFDEKRIGKYIFASDLIVNPGYVGLSIIHGFSYGTPILSCRTSKDGPFHSPEIEYLEIGKNGLLCDPFPSDIARTVSDLLRSPKQLQNMGKNAYGTIQKTCSLENMMKGFSEVLKFFDGMEKTGKERGMTHESK